MRASSFRTSWRLVARPRIERGWPEASGYEPDQRSLLHPCGAPVDSRTREPRFGGAVPDPQARASGTPGPNRTIATEIRILRAGDPPAGAWHPVAVSIRLLDLERVPT